LGLKLGIQPIAVVSAVANQSLGFGSDNALLKGSFDKGDLMRLSSRCVDGDRKITAPSATAMSFVPGAAGGRSGMTQSVPASTSRALG